MNRKNDQTVTNNEQISLDDLRRKQSVRATFKLPQDAIDLLGVIAGQLGIKQKSLLDQLIEDKALLVRLAENNHHHFSDEAARRQKTFVLSRSSLRSINDVAQKQNISRDALVEISIKRLLPVIEAELEKHIIRKALFKEMQKYLKTGENLCDKAHKLLGKDDVLTDMLEKQLNLAERNVAAVAAIIEKGMPMEDW